MLRAGRVLWVLSLLALAQFGRADEPTLLRFDDGTQEDKRSMTGGGHSVRFECPDAETWYVTALSIHGSRYGALKAPNEDFVILIANDDLTGKRRIKKPYSLFERGEEDWVRFDIDPVEVRGAFHVAAFFNPSRTKGIYVGIDTNSSPTHSALVLASNPAEKQSDLQGDWMIRAYVTKHTDKPALPLLTADARSAERRQEEAALDAAILGDARSITLKHDTDGTDEHMNIQGALYTVEFDTPRDVEGYIWQVQFLASQFGSQHDSETVSGDIYILDENRRILTRTTFPYSRVTQEKQWVSIPTLPTKVKGKFYVCVDAHGTMNKGIYLCYQEGNQEHKASTDELDGDHVRPADWSKKFEHMQWLIRAKISDRPVVY